MDGWTRAEVDKAEKKDFALGKGPLRPRDAATLILIDRSDTDPRVLVGRRHMRHAFMPGKFVFPGGRTDPTDARIPIAAGLHGDDERRLTAGRVSRARARAIALSAVREAYEETGILIGEKGALETGKADWQGFRDHGIVPALDRLRFVARAITPPGRVRRYDTRFLAMFRDEVALELPEGGPTDELEELVWLPIAEAREADVPTITRTVLGEVQKRLAEDGALSRAAPVPFYRMLHNRFRRETL